MNKQKLFFLIELTTTTRISTGFLDIDNLELKVNEIGIHCLTLTHSDLGIDHPSFEQVIVGDLASFPFLGPET